MLKENVDITNFGWYRTKSKTRFLFELTSESDLKEFSEILDFASKNNLKIALLWWWTNTLFCFYVFDGIIIRNTIKWFNFENWILEVWSWESVILLNHRLENEFKSARLRQWSWLPWTMWWAIAWNAWCFWLEVQDIFLDAKVYDLEERKIIQISKEKMDFSYRNSILKDSKKYLIISARFDLNNVDSSNFDQDFRVKNQPWWYNCWSVFKNPIWDSAWRLIDAVWLKWMKIWWAQISELHANFIVSDWTATYKDILDIIDLAKQKVKESFSIELIEEIRMIF